jgi:hypothetical protein
VILPSKGTIGSVAFRVIAGEGVFLFWRCMDVLVMPFEISRVIKNVLLS